MGNKQQRPQTPTFWVHLLVTQFTDDRDLPYRYSNRVLGRVECMGIRAAELHLLVHGISGVYEY